jgi:hypothetical protein
VLNANSAQIVWSDVKVLGATPFNSAVIRRNRYLYEQRFRSLPWAVKKLSW